MLTPRLPSPPAARVVRAPRCPETGPREIKKSPGICAGVDCLAQHFRSLSVLLASLLSAALLTALPWLLARLLVLLIGFLLSTTVLAALAALVLTALILILRHFKLHWCERTCY